MTENTGKDSSNRESSPERQSVSLEDLLNVNKGDAIAVRSALEDDEWVLAGQVSSTLTDTADQETVLDRLSDGNTSTLLSINADTWWGLSEGVLFDRSGVLEDRPPAQEYRAESPKNPPPCSLTYWEESRIGLTIPMPIGNTSWVRYYTGDDYGTVVAVDYGIVVNPEHLLPVEYEPP